MLDIEIRDALPGDVKAMAEIAVESFWREYRSLEEAEKAFKGPVARRWENMIKRGAGIALVAEKDGQIVGFLILRWWFGWNGWLEVIAIKKEYRSKGVGTQLMETLMRKAREMGYKRICFAVRLRETLIRFYERFNARRFGELPDEELGRLALYYIPV
ncbi:MAG: hypothetical protein DRJ41_01590 [Thermoprotei archaeon]|nr:MAG: hypothetical protein DRJ41_01590 [Thermoprotei archaeon]